MILSHLHGRSYRSGGRQLTVILPARIGYCTKEQVVNIAVTSILAKTETVVVEEGAPAFSSKLSNEASSAVSNYRL